MTNGTTLAAIINWNGWRDTLACVKSLLAQTGPAVDVLVCDNASTNESCAELCRWVRQTFPQASEDSAHAPDHAHITSFAISNDDPKKAVRSIHVLRLP